MLVWSPHIDPNSVVAWLLTVLVLNLTVLALDLTVLA